MKEVLFLLPVMLVILVSGCVQEHSGDGLQNNITNSTNVNGGLSGIEKTGNADSGGSTSDAYNTDGLTAGYSLKLGDIVSMGSYQVESEGKSPILFMVIGNDNHYAGEVNPAVDHPTLLSKHIIDIRGFDAAEPGNANELREGYGNGRYKTSNIRQWLNSNGQAGAWWSAQNPGDGTPGTNNADALPADGGFPAFDGIGYEDKDGFLRSFSQDELGVILDTTLEVGKNSVTDGGGKETVTDKVFLLSLAEAGFTGKGGATEGSAFGFFTSDASRQATATEQCIENTNSPDKPSYGQAWNWWLRSPSTGFTASTFMVSSIGAALYSTAADMSEGSVGIRPALNIKSALWFSGSGTESDPYVIDFTAVEPATGGGLSDGTNDSTTNETPDNAAQAVVENDIQLTGGDALLHELCQDAVLDYPAWSRSLGAVIAWEDAADGHFNMRYSPDYPTYGMDSPVSGTDTLAGLEFIGPTTLGFAATDGNGWKVGLMPFSVSGGSFSGQGASVIYEKASSTLLDISLISESDFIAFYVRGSDGKAVISRVSGGVEQVLKEFDPSPQFSAQSRSHETQRVSVSPKGTYAYAVYTGMVEGQNTMAVFNLSSGAQAGNVITASSAAWVGDAHILYSSGDEAYLYDVRDGDSQKVNLIGAGAEDLDFCPNAGGLIAYNTNRWGYGSSMHAISCSDWKEVASETNMIAEAIADESTVMFSRYASSGTVEEGGYWRLGGTGWGLHLSYGFSYFQSSPVVATAWNGY